MSSRDSAVTAPAAATVTGIGYRRSAIDAGPFVLAGAALCAVLVTHLVNFGSDHLRVRVLDAGSDSSWSHVVIAIALLVATAIGLVGIRRSATQRREWIAATGVLAFLSISELTSLHARIDEMSWGKLVYAPILLVLCLCLWRISDRTEHRLVIRAGIAMLVVSFGIHVFGPHVVHALGWGTDSWAYQIKVGLKQGTELAGWLLVVWGLWRVARGRGADARA